MNSNVRKITDGAMMAAIAGVILLINRQTGGLMEDLLLFAFPLPMVFYGAKYGWKDSWLVYAGIVLLSFIVGTPQTVFYVASESLIGMIYGCGIYKKEPTGKLILVTIVLAVAVNMVTMVLLSQFFGYDITSEMSAYKDMLLDVGKQTGVVVVGTGNIDAFIRNIFVVSTVLTGVMEGVVTHLISRILLKRLRIYVAPIRSIFEFFPPKWTGYLGIAGLIAYSISMSRPLADPNMNNLLQAAGMACILYLSFFGFVAVLFFLRYRLGVGKVLSVVLAVLSMFLLSIFVALIGFLYITTDMHVRALQRGNDHAPEN